MRKDEEVKIPSGAVAQVGDVVIDRAAYDERFAITAAYQLSRPPPYDPANLKRCAAYKQGERPPEGEKPPTRAELIGQCREQLADFKQRTMQSLVLAQWLEQEAADKEVRVTPAEVRKELVKTTTANFGSPKGYARFQRTTKIPESFFLEQARGAVLTRKLTDKASSEAPKATAAEINEYFRANRKEFTKPERRFVRLLVIRSQAKAAAAYAELKSSRGLEAGGKHLYDRSRAAHVGTEAGRVDQNRPQQEVRASRVQRLGRNPRRPSEDALWLVRLQSRAKSTRRRKRC